ncbi:unnamed protein product [Arctia plantaginis]|uniref:Major facilitator superfamily (MFS) profile domain-containing protein n=1 Tax=Arctia plantaginis TaxID=874455 RepID=A0A8S1AIY7_ARCPL|nr:unnamed protein product [Arctia plantaginis]
MGARSVQIFVALLLSVFVFINASGIVWPSYALKILESENSPLGYQITKSDGNLLGSIGMVGCLTTILFSGYVNEKFGRKRSAVLIGLCFVLSWSIITTAKSVTQLVIGRFIFGMAGGMQIVLGYDVVNYINLSIPVSLIVALSFLKETPPYLLKMGKQEEALLSLKFYRGATTVSQDILEEFAYMRQQQMFNKSNAGLPRAKLIEKQNEKEDLNLEDLRDSHENVDQNPWKILRESKSSQRAIVLIAIQMILSVCVGMIGIQTYAGQMFRRAAPHISPDLCSVLLAIVLAIAGSMAIVITDMIPRRILMISSSLMAAVSMALLGSLLRWSWAPEWAIPLTIVIYCIFFQIGVINVPFVQVGECVSPQLKTFGTTVGMFSMFLANFLVLFLFEPAVSIIGLNGVFFVFAIMGVVSATVAFFFMRETRKVPFEIIQETFEVGFVYRKH